MAASSNPQNDFPLEASIPEGAISLESMLCTDEFRRRPWHPPDYEKENRALLALTSALANARSDVLQTLADTILDVIQCDSSGLSLLSMDDRGKKFRWAAICGMWKLYIGREAPRNFGPSGDDLVATTAKEDGSGAGVLEPAEKVRIVGSSKMGLLGIYSD